VLEVLDNRLGQAAAAGLLLVAAVTILVAVYAHDGSDGDHGVAASHAAQPAGRFTDARAGYRLRHPSDWIQRTGRGGSVELASPDGSVALAISSPTAGRIPVTVTRAGIAQLGRAYRPARVLSRTGGKLGPLPARTIELSGRAKGRPVRALLAVAASRYRTYTAQVTTQLRPSGRRLREAQAILASLRFSRPRR
jgi:hypothetical protein